MTAAPAEEGPVVATGPSQPTSQYGTDTDLRRKRLADLQAKFAARGFALDQLAEGGLLLSRWNLSRHLSGLAEAERVLQQIGGAA